MAERITICACADTDVGLVRTRNQDVAYAWVGNSAEGDALALLVVADGMGGYEAADEAATLAVDTVSKWLPHILAQRPSGFPVASRPPAQMVQEAIQLANMAVYNHAHRPSGHASEMGTTVACVLVRRARAVLAHVGDSRVYILRQHGLEQLTADHSVTGELVEDGFLDADDVHEHPQRHILTRALGLSPSVEVDVDTVPLRPGDRLLLCSDGLWAMVPDLQLEGILVAEETPEETVAQLIAAANTNGGEDNIAVVVCDVLVARSHRGARGVPR
jgi:protein phosphatase